MNVRDVREGVAARFSAAKAALSMETISLVTAPIAASTPSSTTGAAAAIAAPGQLCYTVREGSRTDLFTRSDVYITGVLGGARDTSSSGIGSDVSTNHNRVEGGRFPNNTAAVRAECLRCQAFNELVATLRRTMTGELAARAGAAVAPAELEELRARWVVQSIDSLSDASQMAVRVKTEDPTDSVGSSPLLARENATSWDVGATAVLLRPSSAVSHVVAGSQPPSAEAEDKEAYASVRIVGAAPMTGGQYWLDVVPLASFPDAALAATTATVKRVDQAAVRLRPAVPTHLDSFLPCDDIATARGTSACLYLATLLAARGTGLGRSNRASTAPAAVTTKGRALGSAQRASGDEAAAALAAATAVANTMAVAARECRQNLAARIRRECLSSSVASAVAKVEPTTTTRDTAISTTAELEAEPAVTVAMKGDTLTLTVCMPAARDDTSPPPSVQLLRRAARKLAGMWDLQRSRTCSSSSSIAASSTREKTAEEPARMQLDRLFAAGTCGPSTAHTPLLNAFFSRLYVLLLRYQLLLGERGYNQGPQAAVPPTIIAALQERFHITVEGFASPLNAQLPRYGSLFPDTDACFGSIGAFSDIDIQSGHVEVNPPFDATVVARMARRLLASLAAADTRAESLLFVVVLPSHDADVGAGRDGEDAAGARVAADWAATAGKRPRPQDEGSANAAKPCVGRTLRESRFCLAHALCPAAEAAYVDGHQHLLRAPFFCIGTPTRLTVLGNAAARARYPDAAQRLLQVRDAWRQLTQEELT